MRSSCALCTLVRVLFAIIVGSMIGSVAAADWKSLSDDQLHAPESAALGVLQDPGEALKLLPPDTAGNKVDWVGALRGGYIKPRSGLHSDAPVEVLKGDIIMRKTGVLPFVRFPHEAHTEWLDCANCHEEIFKSQAGATPVNMYRILEGEFCGVCHGAVAFPLTECNRCHSEPSKAANP